MKGHIKVNFYTIPNTQNFNQIHFANLKIKKNTMVFISRKCYLNICNNDFYFCEPGLNMTKFWIKNSNYDSISSAAIKPIHGTNWYLLKYLKFDTTNYTLNSDILSNILFIFYENEFEKKEINAFFVIADEDEVPANFITKDLPEFKNSMFFLTHDPYITLKTTTNTISIHEGLERLTWKYDEVYNYPGGTIMLNSLKDNYLYFIENMNFPFFAKNFSIEGLPDTLYFIL